MQLNAPTVVFVLVLVMVGAANTQNIGLLFIAAGIAIAIIVALILRGSK